jgi:hypothetical protein
MPCKRLADAKLQAETPLDNDPLLQGCTLTRHFRLCSLSWGHSYA